VAVLKKNLWKSIEFEHYLFFAESKSPCNEFLPVLRLGGPYRSYVSEGLGGGFVGFPTEKPRKGTGMIES